MFCPRCNAVNQDDAMFCQSCGAKLHIPQAVNATPNNNDKGLLYALIIMGWEMITMILWVVLQKVIVPVLKLPFESLRNVYNAAEVVTTFVTVILLVIFAIIVNSNMARTFFIIFAVLRVIVFIAYKIPVVSTN